MKNYIIVFFLSGVLTNLSAQGKTFTLYPGQSLGDILSVKELYSYPDFSTGTVYKSDGSSAKASLNYNILLAEMQFIYSGKDTLVISNSHEIDSIELNSDIYYVVDNMYYKKLAGGSKLALLDRYYMEISEETPQGLVNRNSAGITNMHPGYFIKNHSKMYEFTSNKTLNFTIKVDKFFHNQHGFFSPRKSRLLNEYPANKKELKGFINTQSINFGDTSDLIELTNFVNTLEKI